MKKCKKCGVDLTAQDGDCKRIIWCRKCRIEQKRVKNATYDTGTNLKSHHKEYREYSKFVTTLSDIEIQALIQVWGMKRYRGKGKEEKQKARTVLKILTREYSLRTGDRIINIEEGEMNEC